MALKSIQDILKTVEQPSRYAGSEFNAIVKEKQDVKLTMALVFPDLYEIGTSHFGIQILYHILNKQKDIYAERVYAPAPDMEKELRENRIPMFSRETKTPLGEFGIVGFSLLYELNYTNILTVLDLAGIPFLSSERNENHPLIIAGGPCTFNPEPVADLFDAMVIGDGEDVVLEISKAYIQWKENNGTRHELLKTWSTIRGVYIPSFFQPEYISKGSYSLQVLKPCYDDYRVVHKATISDLETADFPDSPVLPLGRPVHERMRLEISRGCSRGCRFCQAGMIYRPVRERSVKNLVGLADKTICSTGYEDMSLLSLSTGDYENLSTLMLELLDVSEQKSFTHKNISFSLPSIRAGRLNTEMMEIIKRVRKTGFTIAPEAGSQRLRDVINKGITEEDIILTVKSAFELGWTVIKLYFMIGLPTETDEDLEEIVKLVKVLRSLNTSRGKKAQINVSVTTFIPKAHCPFQWEKQITQEESWEKILWLKERLNIHGVTLKWGKTQISYLEGLMARGDRRLAPVIINAYRKGCRLDGWSEHFRMDLWEQAIQDENIDAHEFCHRVRIVDEPLPWDHICSGVSRDFLAGEREKSTGGELTEDCRYGTCSNCGVCDFVEIKPRIQEKINYQPTIHPDNDGEEKNYKKIKCVYEKTGDAKFLGHMELVNLFSKALRRSGLPLKYSSGFHKIIKIVCSNPLPVGYESLEEFFVIEVHDDFDTNRIMNEINQQLQGGLKIKECSMIVHRRDIQEKPNKRFSLSIKGFDFSKDCIDDFENRDEFFFEKTNKKGERRSLNLKDFVRKITVDGKGLISFDLMSSDGAHVRPDDAIKQIFSISQEEMEKADIIKLRHFG